MVRVRRLRSRELDDPYLSWMQINFIIESLKRPIVALFGQQTHEEILGCAASENTGRADLLQTYNA
jgi:hypothetical protein